MTSHRPTTTLRRCLARVAILCMSLGCFGIDAQNATPVMRSEYEVKAAVLYKAAKFIEWPEQAFTAKNQPFILCVVGSDQVARAFASLDQRPLQRRNLSVRRMGGDTLDLRQCHAVFFADRTNQDVDYALRGLANYPILTVGETEDFVQRGGALALTTQNNKIRFTVNLRASKQADLAVSSQLLQLATVVGATAQ
jgi:hypothetical protein